MSSNPMLIWDYVAVDAHVVRPVLGNVVTMEAYRLLRYSLGDILAEELGSEKASALLRLAGDRAGTAFFKAFCSKADSLASLARILEEQFAKHGMGLLRIERMREDEQFFSLVVSEDIDCSGLPERGETVCVYSEGFIQGVIRSFTGKPCKVQETECWGTGARLCRFTVVLLE